MSCNFCMASSFGISQLQGGSTTSHSTILFPIVMTKAKGNRLYDIDGNEYFDFPSGGPTIIGSNDDVVKEKVKELLDDLREREGRSNRLQRGSQTVNNAQEGGRNE